MQTCLIQWIILSCPFLYLTSVFCPDEVLWLYTGFWSSIAPVENDSKYPTCKLEPFTFTFEAGKTATIDSMFFVSGAAKHCVEPMCGLKIPPHEGVFAYIARNGSEVKGEGDLPQECQTIYHRDTVDSKTGQACHAWCQEVMGTAASDWKFTPLCSGPLSNNNSGPNRMYQACGKAAAHMRFRFLPPWLKYIVSLAYGMPGMASGWREFSKPHAGLVLKKTLHTPLIKNGFRKPGPFAAWYFAPLRILTRGDSSAYSLMFVLKAFLTLLEPPLDLFSAWSFFEDGEPLFAFITIFGFFFVMDPCQCEGYRATAASWRDGYETQEYMTHKMREGFYEAPFGACIALIALFTTPDLSVSQTVVFATNFAITFFVTLPDAMKAKVLLDANQDPGDAYKVHNAKNELTCLAMSISVAMLPGALGFLAIRQYKYDMSPSTYFINVYLCTSVCILQSLRNSISMENKSAKFLGQNAESARFCQLGFTVYGSVAFIYQFSSTIRQNGPGPLFRLLHRMIVPSGICLGAALVGGVIVGLASWCEPDGKMVSDESYVAVSGEDAQAFAPNHSDHEMVTESSLAFWKKLCSCRRRLNQSSSCCGRNA